MPRPRMDFPTPPHRPGYSVADLAELFRVDEKTIRRHIDAGKIASKKIGARRWISADEVDRLMADGL